ncbi:chemotaxis protein CheC [Methanolacinia petrolearia]|uniref:chemotaxis protein CheC n=1 Tax=Methanolacinia petrolearia TaxID=54120 RepID=UPI003BAA9BAA
MEVEINMNVSPEDFDTLTEIMNIGVGKVASLLNEITASHIRLSVPQVQIININDIGSQDLVPENEICAQVRLDFSGPFSGTSVLVFPSGSAAALVMAITDEKPDTPELDLIRAETLKEVGNLFINGVMGSIGNFLREHISYSLPDYYEDKIEVLKDFKETTNNENVLLTTTNFYVENINVTGIIFLMLEIESLNLLLKKIETISAEESSGL